MKFLILLGLLTITLCETEQQKIIVDCAKEQLGKPYVYGHHGPDAFDCSGLTMYCLARIGVSVPHVAHYQFEGRNGKAVAKADLLPGDLVGIRTKTDVPADHPSHCGIYVGDGQFIHAPAPGKVVTYENIDSKLGKKIVKCRRYWV